MSEETRAVISGLSLWTAARARLFLVMHVGHAFVSLGFLLIAGATAFPQQIPISEGIHAWRAGAVWTMTLAIMTRVSPGHTGRSLSANWLTQAIYALVLAAVRIAANFSPNRALGLLHSAASLWIAAFWGSAVGY